MAPNGPDPITKSGPRQNRNYSAGATAPSLYSFQSLAGRSSRQNVARTGPGRLLAAAAGAGTLNQALDGRFGQILTASKESGSARSRVFPQSARQTYWNVWGNALAGTFAEGHCRRRSALASRCDCLAAACWHLFPDLESRNPHCDPIVIERGVGSRPNVPNLRRFCDLRSRATETVPVARISPELRPRRRRRARDDRRIEPCSAH